MMWELNKQIDLGVILNEPNCRVFLHNNHMCVVVRQPMGHFCGYVGVRKKSNLYGVSYYTSTTLVDEDDNLINIELDKIQKLVNDISIHGGLTYGGCNLPIIDIFGDDIYWFGFDCAHAGDLRLYEMSRLSSFSSSTDTYKDYKYTEEQVKSLSDQLLKIEKIKDEGEDTNDSENTE